jgi:hypothetical protein
VQSQTGYVICLANCPVSWKSKMQTEIALSTMEAEYVALSTSCGNLFPLIDIKKELCIILDLKLLPDTHLYIKKYMKTTCKLEPRCMTPQSTHYAIKYHWFGDKIGPRNIQLVRISSEDQLGDLFTKGLGCVIF